MVIITSRSRRCPALGPESYVEADIMRDVQQPEYASIDGGVVFPPTPLPTVKNPDIGLATPADGFWCQGPRARMNVTRGRALSPVVTFCTVPRLADFD